MHFRVAALPRLSSRASLRRFAGVNGVGARSRLASFVTDRSDTRKLQGDYGNLNSTKG